MVYPSNTAVSSQVQSVGATHIPLFEAAGKRDGREVLSAELRNS